MNLDLNDAFRKNRELFARRFPDLAALTGLASDAEAERTRDLLPASCELVASSSGSPTLSVAGSFVHSKVDPVREAERAFAARGVFDSEGCLFCGCGLGYLPELYAARYPAAPILIVEPELSVLMAFLASRPLEGLLSHPNLVIVAGIPASEAAGVPERVGLPDIASFESAALVSPNKPWWDEFREVRARTREKREINANTLRKFGDLWLRNMCKNLPHLRERGGIEAYENFAAGLPALVLAAGPSLDSVLPRLPALARRCVVIAVDTAVRACLSVGVEPDFIVLVDPQYWNFRHLDSLSCPRSVLIAESAVWPAVLRFPCARVCLCASLFPLGRYLESRAFARAELGAGGSVSTTAWDFARYSGAEAIYMAGLDLGYPGKRTHFSGSVFEERSHAVSTRLEPAETAGFRALTATGLRAVSDYSGGSLLTDKRLILYAWWFESKIAANSARPTYTLTPEGVRIPGIGVARTDDVAALPDKRGEIDARMADALSRPETGPDDARAFDLALDRLVKAVEGIVRLAERGKRLSVEGMRPGVSRSRQREILSTLEEIDRTILASEAKEVAAMVFSLASDATKDASPLEASRRLYEALVEAGNRNLGLIASGKKEFKKPGEGADKRSTGCTE